jgi:hypothetical protein
MLVVILLPQPDFHIAIDFAREVRIECGFTPIKLTKYVTAMKFKEDILSKVPFISRIDIGSCTENLGGQDFINRTSVLLIELKETFLTLGFED